MATKRKGPALSEEELLATTGHDPESELRENLSRKGYLVVKQERVTGIRERIDTGVLHGDWVRIGLVSDMHFGSQHQQLMHLHKAYRLFKEEGITTILNAGDIIDGQRVYRGQEFELFCHGVDAQVDYAIKNYPREEGITTYFISGNHDESHWKHAGVDIGKPIAAAREDMKYLCVGGATVTIPDDPETGVDIYLSHPIGGLSYARCFHPSTDVLTKSGWVPVGSIVADDQIATRREDGFLEWQSPTGIFSYDWDGDLHHYKARTFDLLVTPNHNMFVRRYPGLINRKSDLTMPQKSHQRVDVDWGLLESTDILNGSGWFRQKWQMSREVQWRGEEIATYTLPPVKRRKYGSEPRHFDPIGMDLWLQFLGWYVSEGCTSGRNGYKYYTSICQNNPRGHALIRSLLDCLGWECVERERAFAIPGGELAQHLDDIVGVGSKNKRAPAFIKDLSPRQIWLFLEAALEGDGSYDKRRGSWGHYTTYSQQLRDDMQELFLKCGIGATVTKRGVSLSWSQNFPTINRRPDVVHYDGPVHCVEVPNHVLLVRRNGRAVWCGNSYKPQKRIEQFASEQKPKIVIWGHWHCQDVLPMYRNVYSVMMPCFQSQTSYLKALGLNPEIGPVILEYMPDGEGGVSRIRHEFVPEFRPIKDDY